jgi:hypothetical protein
MAFHDMDFPGDVTDLPGLHRAHVLDYLLAHA